MSVRVYLACSLDGFIAGPDHDLSWLPSARGEAEPGYLSYETFIGGVGTLLMGRGTYDVVAGFESPWPYGQTRVLVATSRPLKTDVPTVRAVNGDIRTLIEQAKSEASGKDVYLDGGRLVRSGLEADLVDELTLTLIPVILGRGIPLFAGLDKRLSLQLASHSSTSTGLVQLSYRPVGSA